MIDNRFCLDPGHGPGDGVMEGMSEEHAYCYNMAVRVFSLLGPDLTQVELSRLPGEDPTNIERAKTAHTFGSRLTISIHNNAGPESYHGAHAFYTQSSRVARAVAEAIMRGWPAELSRSSLYGRWAGKTWVEGAVAVPHPDYWPRVHNVFEAYRKCGQELVLVETHYKTNPQEEELAHREGVQREMAMAIARGILVADRRIRTLDQKGVVQAGPPSQQ